MSDLPPLCLNSMTKVQLEKLVPQLVTQATGRSSPLFGSVSTKPAWWPEAVDWIDLDQLSLKYENPCETLREIVRSCYQHSEKEDLLHVDESFIRSMPSSPLADTDMCVADQTASTTPPCDIPENMEVEDNNESNRSNDNKTEKENNTESTPEESHSAQVSKIKEEQPCQEASKPGAGKAPVGNISPSILAEIDKHIAESINSKIMDMELKKQKGVPSLKYLGKTVVPMHSKHPAINEQLRKPSGRDPAHMKGSGSVKSGGFPESSSKLAGSQHKDVKPNKPKCETKLTTPAEITKKTEAVQNTPDDDDVVWICFICAKGFSNQDELMSHQDVCEEDTDMEVKPSTNNKPEQTIKTEAINQNSGNNGTTKLPVPALLRKVGSDMKSLPLGLPTKPRIFPTRKRKRHKDIYIPPPRDTYFESLGLVPTPKIEQIKTPLKSDNLDCQIIDLTLDDDKSPQSQSMTPRTHLIMSQVSREETTSGRRRQLSFSQMTPPRAVRNRRKVETDTESSDDCFDYERVPRKNVPCKSVILAIPLTSLLGQRLKKHWQNDNKIPTISNVESYCQTLNVQCFEDPYEIQRKNKFTEKLRNRPPPQVTFRFTKKYINKWFHKYKFNRLDNLEFQRILKTGLERESRILLKKMKRCKVSLERMSAADIKQWTHPPRRPQKFMSNLQLMRRNYNDQIRMSLLQAGGPRYNRPLQLIGPPVYLQSVQPRAMLNSSHPMFAQVQKYTTDPIPQFLVRNVPNGANSSQLELVPVQKVYTGTPQSTTMRQKRPFKNGIIQDNTVICLSSDDEEDEEITPPPCHSCKQAREACLCNNKGREKPKIGPASFMKHQQSLQQRAQVLRKPTNPNSNLQPGIVNTGKADSVSSRVFGKNSFVKDLKPHTQVASQPELNRSMPKGHGIASDTNSVLSSPSVKTDYTRVRLVNGKIVNPNQKSGNTLERPGSPTKTGFSQQPPDSPTTQGNSPDDSEYLDFEVICIDSDDDS